MDPYGPGAKDSSNAQNTGNREAQQGYNSPQQHNESAELFRQRQAANDAEQRRLAEQRKANG